MLPKDKIYCLRWKIFARKVVDEQVEMRLFQISKILIWVEVEVLYVVHKGKEVLSKVHKGYL